MHEARAVSDPEMNDLCPNLGGICEEVEVGGCDGWLAAMPYRCVVEKTQVSWHKCTREGSGQCSVTTVFEQNVNTGVAHT